MDERSMAEVRDFDPAEHLRDDADIAGYLRLAIDEGDPDELGAALAIAARARGMMDLAQRTGLSREALYAAARGETELAATALIQVCDAIGGKLSARAD